MHESDKFIVLFDGVCNLCNGFVNFVIERDPKNKFLFASLQSSKAKSLLANAKSVPNGLETIVLIKGDRIFLRSTAALKIARELSGLWPIFYVFLFVPTFIRDFFYKLIANNRYRIFGKQDECRIPTPELSGRFILDSNDLK